MDLMIVVIFLAGLVLGTLLNIVVIRWPRCTRCGRPLAVWQLLPLVGWLAQAGRGRCCGRTLSWLFPLNELIAGIALARFYVLYGFRAPLRRLALGMCTWGSSLARRSACSICCRHCSTACFWPAFFPQYYWYCVAPAALMCRSISHTARFFVWAP